MFCKENVNFEFRGLCFDIVKGNYKVYFILL